MSLLIPRRIGDEALSRNGSGTNSRVVSHGVGRIHGRREKMGAQGPREWTADMGINPKPSSEAGLALCPFVLVALLHLCLMKCLFL